MAAEGLCAALEPRSQHGDLGHLLDRAESVLGEPADVAEASQRPPRADQVAVDVGAVPGDDVVEVLRVSQGERGEVTGIIDWSEAAQGDALYDLASLTLGHPEHLGDVVAGYGTDVDRDLIRAWWSLRCLSNIRWLVENGYGSPDGYPEVAVLRRA